MELFGFKHQKQQRRSDCLVACTAMVLTFLGIPNSYPRLSKQLGTTEDGTSFSNLVRLEAMGLSVDVGRYRDSTTLVERHLSIGLPIIVAVKTWPLPYWNMVDTDHAAVVTGIEGTLVRIADPAFDHSPHFVPVDYFLTSWSERDFEYGVIGLTGRIGG